MTDGLILREYATVAENDRFVAILTRDRGLVRASARGARNVKSRLAAGTQPLCYSRLSLIPGKDKYIVEDARPQEVFFSLREDVDRMALGQYFCELALHMTPTEAPAPDHLRLILNGLFFLGNGEKDTRLIKAVTEARLLLLEGYAPDLSGCGRCGNGLNEGLFSPSSGTLFCPTCQHPADAAPVSAPVLAALRYVFSCEAGRCFSFTLPPEEMDALGAVTEQFLLTQQQRSYATLSFYHSLHT